MFMYDDNSVRTPFVSRVPYNELNAVGNWQKHYSNLLELQFYLRNGSTQEKLRAQHEIAICEKKLKYWAQHPNYNTVEATRVANKLKQQWGVK